MTLHLHILSSISSQYQRLCKEQGRHALEHLNFPSPFPQTVLQCLLLQSASDEGNNLVLNTHFLKSTWDLVKQRVLGMLASKYLIMIKCILHFSFLSNTTLFLIALWFNMRGEILRSKQESFNSSCFPFYCILHNNVMSNGSAARWEWETFSATMEHSYISMADLYPAWSQCQTENLSLPQAACKVRSRLIIICMS